MGWNGLQRYFMQKIFLRNRPLVTRLLVSSAILVIIPMLMIGIISYHRSSTVLENETRQYSWQIIEQVKSHVEHYVRDIEIISLKIINHPDMVRLIKMNPLDEAGLAAIRQPVSQLLQNSAYSRSDISNISLFMNDGLMVDLRGDYSTKPMAQLKDEYWYKSAPANGEPMLVSRVTQWRGGSEPVISIVKRLVSPHTLSPIGMLVIDVNYKRFQEIADLVTIGKTGYMVIMDSQGHYVYHPDLSQLGTKAQLEGMDAMQKNGHGSFVTSSPVSDFLTYSHSTFLGWTLVTSIPYLEMTAGADYIGRTIIYCIAVTLGIAYLFGIGLASSIIGPVRQLQRLMKSVELGDFKKKAVVSSRDELGMLAHGFNKMVGNLSELLDQIYFSKLRETEMTLQQKETELKMLQAQVNPHFLYNSLETIRGMALDRGMDDISDMASSLARLLRYNLKSTSPYVTLKDELEICEMYLRIQKFRFEDKLEYEFDVPELYRSEKIAKFSIQPIVENCVVHGYEAGSGMTRIRISAQVQADRLYVNVEDSGAGIPQEQLIHIRENLLDGGPETAGNHIGLRNVHRRIAHLFGESYGISVDSILGKGTRVSLCLPRSQAERRDKMVEYGEEAPYA
ncbi:cache domain-containing sensor histidine kinase [Gorillibacterium sp. sgz5001074]|uniref:cache domain-containing sensor histidine kinase n=1 Tax=Gorillibacterium sp. sgz5001074 TaxID=3446695 RepID=UPI003F67259A